MKQYANKRMPLCLVGAGFLWGWSFLFFFASQFDSAISPVFWVGDVVYLGSTLATSLLVAAIFRKKYRVDQLHRLGNVAFALMLTGSIALALASVGVGGVPFEIGGKLLAGPGQGLFWIVWTTTLARFDIEKAETAFLMWIPLLVAVLMASSLALLVSPLFSQIIYFLLMAGLPVATWATFRAALGLSTENREAPDAFASSQVPPANETKGIGSMLWLFINLSIALAVIMVVWSTFLFRHTLDMGRVETILSLGALVALPIVWFALRVTRRFGPSSLYRWAVPILTLGIVFDFAPGDSMMWSACLCLGIVSIGFEGMYHLAFIYASKRFADRALFVASLGVAATTLGGLAGSAAWAMFLNHLSAGAASGLPLVLLFILVLCSSCAPRSEGVSGFEQKEPAATTASGNTSIVEERCEVLAERYDLTPREREVLALLVQGRSRTFIREALFISKGTVDTHIHHIYSKMGIGSKDALAVLVFDAAEGGKRFHLEEERRDVPSPW